MKVLKGWLGGTSNEEDTAQRAQIRVELWRMIGLLHGAMGPGMAEELGAILRSLAANSDQIEKGISAWIGLIEVLVQGSEQRRRKGGGQLKKAEVKSAMHDILSSSRFELPSIPHYLQPIVIDFFVDWSIDALVEAANGYQLWASPDLERAPIRGLIDGLLNRVLEFARPLLEGAAELASTLYVQLRYWAPLTPELRTALDKVKKDGLITNKQDLMRKGTELVIFVGQHGKQVTALFQLVFEAVREAQFIASLGKAQKKEYAINLIMEVLSEIGFPVDSPLFSAIVRAVVSGGIESALDVFQTRDPLNFPSSKTQAVTA